MAILCEHFGRAFRTIGDDGGGRPLFATIMNSAMRPTRGLSNAMRFRSTTNSEKKMGHIVGRCVFTAQEGTDGGSDNKRNHRKDLYKKIWRPDPVSRVLPYAKSRKMSSANGMLRFDLNQALTLTDDWGKRRCSIYRRSLMRENANSPPLVE